MGDPAVRATPKRRTREEILDVGVPLFAAHGYDGVAMRDIAIAAGLTPAALYYHFADKDQLYLEAVTHAFVGRTASLAGILARRGPPWARLERFVEALARLTAEEKDFLRLMQWVMLDRDQARQQKLAGQVFKDLFAAVSALAVELDSRLDAHLLATSIIGLVVFPFEAGASRRFLPGYRQKQSHPATIAKHAVNLLRKGLAGRAAG